MSKPNPFQELQDLVANSKEKEELISQMMIDYEPEAMLMVLEHTIKTLHRKVERAMKAYNNNL